jgi:hypothetical protein
MLLGNRHQLFGDREDVGLLRLEIWRGSCPPFSALVATGGAVASTPRYGKLSLAGRCTRGTPWYSMPSVESSCFSKKSKTVATDFSSLTRMPDQWQKSATTSRRRPIPCEKHKVIRKSASRRAQTRNGPMGHPGGSKRQQEAVKNETEKQGGQLVPLLSAPRLWDRSRLPIRQVCHIVRLVVQCSQQVNIRYVQLPEPPPQGFVVH